MNTIISKKSVEELPSIKKVDELDNLSLYCYTECDDESSDLIKQCRGLVFKGDELIFKGYGYTPEYTHDDIELLKGLKLEDYTACTSYEGTLVRLFHTDKWYVSTHKRLDVFNSRWGTRRTFGELLTEALIEECDNNLRFRDLTGDVDNKDIYTTFLSILDKSKQYTLLLRSCEENRIVCHSGTTCRVFHVGTFEKGKLNLEDCIGLPKPETYTFDSIDDLFEHVQTMDAFSCQGIILLNQEKQLKITIPLYKRLYVLRDNEPSVKFQYLKIRTQGYSKLRDFCKLYAEHQDSFDLYENVLYDIALSVYSAYVKRFIHKKFIQIPTSEYFIMKKCHAWHLEDRKRNVISFNRVMEEINRLEPYKLNRLIKNRLRAESKEATTQEPEEPIQEPEEPIQ